MCSSAQPPALSLGWGDLGLDGAPLGSVHSPGQDSFLGLDYLWEYLATLFSWRPGSPGIPSRKQVQALLAAGAPTLCPPALTSYILPE